jgi:hypothetical protein
MSKALVAHHTAPLALDPRIIAQHVEQVSPVGLYNFLQQSYLAVSHLSLQPSVVTSEFASVSTFQPLTQIVSNSVETSVHETFVPNGGYNCTPYDNSVADPALIGLLLASGHRNGRFIAVPMSLAQSCVEKERLKMNVSEIFTAVKRDSVFGRLVSDYKVSRSNHLDKKLSLPAKFGKINSSQLGLICQLVESAHILFPGNPHRL